LPSGLSLFSGVPHVRAVELNAGHSLQIAIRFAAMSKILFIVV